MFKVHFNNDFIMAVSDLHSFGLAAYPEKGSCQKKRFSEEKKFSSGLYLSGTTSNEILAKLDYSLCTFGAFLISEFCRKRFSQTTKVA